MGWKAEETVKLNQTKLFVELTSEEKLLFDILRQQDKMAIDNIALTAQLPMSKTASLLLEMEFKNVIKSLPGKMYKAV
jgi:DNA processing protein